MIANYKLPAMALAMTVAGCSPFQRSPALPVSNSVSLSQLVIYSDFELPRDHRLLRELDSLRNHVSMTLALPVSEEPIHVYLFKTPNRYTSFMQKHYPDFPDRRAFFVKTDTRLNVYAQWGDQIGEDLRHEVTHGYLHAVTHNVPLWMDEGLAEYFEVGREAQGHHSGHMRTLREAMASDDWRPSLKRMAKLKTAAQMEQVDYAEAWAWAHFLLHTDSRRRGALKTFLRDSHEQRGAGSLAKRLLAAEPDVELKLGEYVNRIRRQNGASLP
jgi:hypothetical protein